MAVRLFARGSDGVVCIADASTSESTFQDYVSNPYKNIDNINFHSSFDYMSLAAKFTTSITFSARAASSTTQSVNKGKGSVTIQLPEQGTQRHQLGTHGLGYTPFATATRGNANRQVTPTFQLQKNGAAIRLVNVEMDSNKIYVYESWVTFTNALAATTQTFNCWVFRNPE